MQNLEEKVQSIIERNSRVEADKAWETSWVRRAIITALTYIVIVILMHSIRDPNPFFNALVPTFAFVVSTSIVPLAKNWWLLNIYKK